jgi:sporulation protein YlmC with PRC-barrel domain
MLDTARSLKDYQLLAKDGAIGKVEDLYFDDKHWAVRYLVAGTGGWLRGRQVLVSPRALSGVDRKARTLSVRSTKAQIEESPLLAKETPVSKQFEESYHAYYGWPMYWGGPYMWGGYPFLTPDPNEPLAPSTKHDAWDPHLRSANHVTGFILEASDGEIGRVDDFVIEDSTWAIRYLVVATHHWWPGKKVLISPRWVENINWDHAGSVKIGLTREAIRSSPPYDEQALLTRDHEQALHRHYGRPGYWPDAQKHD